MIDKSKLNIAIIPTSKVLLQCYFKCTYLVATAFSLPLTVLRIASPDPRIA